MRGDLEETKRELESLIQLLPGAIAKDLLNEAKRGELGTNARVDVLRESLMSYLSARRPDKMRRAFTKPLEPYLVDEDWLVLSAQDVPGLISRIDAGALWATASFHSQGSHAADRLSQISAQAEAGGFIETNEAMVVHEAATFVSRQIDHAAADRQSLYEWLQSFNTARAAAADALGKTTLSVLRPRTAQWLVWVAEVLNAGEILSRHFVNLRTQLAGSSEPWDPKRGVGLLMAARGALDIDLRREGLRLGLADMVPAVALNVSLAYGMIAEFMRQAKSGGDVDMAGLALVAHALALIGALDRQLGASPGGHAIEIFLDFLETAMSAIRQAGVKDPAVQAALGRLTLRARTNPAFHALARRLEALA